MASIVKHRKVNIVVLDQDEPIVEHCKPGDIAICAADDGWLWAAKAAAEFGV
jgi:hypothetical protein